MSEFSSSDVARVYQSYPDHVRSKLLSLRKLVVETASALDGADHVDETLTWGKPSYPVKGGSTLRLAKKPSNPNYFAMCFHCQLKLVETFRELYRDVFRFQGNRAILFEVNDVKPRAELKHCLTLYFRYHSLKHLPLLGE